MNWESIKKKNMACKECNYLLVSLDFCPNLCNSWEWYTCDNPHTLYQLSQQSKSKLLEKFGNTSLSYLMCYVILRIYDGFCLILILFNVPVWIWEMKRLIIG